MTWSCQLRFDSRRRLNLSHDVIAADRSRLQQIFPQNLPTQFLTPIYGLINAKNPMGGDILVGAKGLEPLTFSV
jgi:hypothetical protein